MLASGIKVRMVMDGSDGNYRYASSQGEYDYLAACAHGLIMAPQLKGSAVLCLESTPLQSTGFKYL